MLLNYVVCTLCLITYSSSEISGSNNSSMLFKTKLTTRTVSSSGTFSLGTDVIGTTVVERR